MLERLVARSGRPLSINITQRERDPGFHLISEGREKLERAIQQALRQPELKRNTALSLLVPETPSKLSTQQTLEALAGGVNRAYAARYVPAAGPDSSVTALGRPVPSTCRISSRAVPGSRLITSAWCSVSQARQAAASSKKVATRSSAMPRTCSRGVVPVKRRGATPLQHLPGLPAGCQGDGYARHEGVPAPA